MRENGTGRGNSRLPILQSGSSRISVLGEQKTAFERYGLKAVSGGSGAMRNGKLDWDEQIPKEGGRKILKAIEDGLRNNKKKDNKQGD